MLSYCTDYLSTMPDITVFMNCDTRLAINLRIFNLSDTDEFIFAIKNYNYIDSPYVFLFRARKTDLNEDGEVIFKIPSEASKNLKPGAFYNFGLLTNALDRTKETEYIKLTDNGRVLIAWGAQDLLVPVNEANQIVSQITGARLESIPLEEIPEDSESSIEDYEIVGVKLIPIEEYEEIEIPSEDQEDILLLSEIVGARFEPITLDTGGK